MNSRSRIYVAGHRGLVGSAIVRVLRSRGYENLVTRAREDLDLTNPSAVDSFFVEEKPEYVFLAAAKVGGILANSRYPVEFLRDNLYIELAVIEAAFRHGAKKLMFLGSSCIYPKFAPQPIKEEALLGGKLEPTNEPYAIAKIAGIKLCQAYARQYGANFVSVMPTNLYGPGDSFDPENSHVLPALIRRFHEAKENDEPTVTVWGTGKPRREFLYVDDLADACAFLMRNDFGRDVINVGVGEDVSIDQLARLVREIVGYRGSITYDATKPDGTPRKLLDVGRLHSLGWLARIPLREGIERTYDSFLSERPAAVGATT